MTAPSSPATATASNTRTGESDIVCSACGKCGVEFSNRQRNKATMGEPARCKSCVDNDTPINRNQEQKENTQNEQEEKKEDQKERLYFWAASPCQESRRVT